MKIEGEGKLLRVFVGEKARHEGVPLYKALVLKAREMGVAGATVLRGIEGFGANSRLHTASLLRLSEDLPIVIEIADRADRIDEIIPHFDQMVEEGMITLERVQIIKYRSSDTAAEV